MYEPKLTCGPNGEFVDFNGQLVQVGKPFAPHPAEFRGASHNDRVHHIKARAKEYRGLYKLDGIPGPVVVSADVAGKMSKAFPTPEQADAAHNLPLILASAKYEEVQAHAHGDPNVKSMHRLDTCMQYGERLVLVKVTVRELANQAYENPDIRHKLYHVEAWDVGRV